MARSPEPGRTALLEAGTRQLAGTGLAELSVNQIVAAAHMAKGAFYQHWDSRRAYLRELHTRFHDRLMSTVLTKIGDQPPGLDRCSRIVTTCLDGFLSEPATKALLVQARTHADLTDLVVARNASFASLVEPDLAALGWSDPTSIATLLIAAAAEIALHELTDHAPRPDLRKAIINLANRPPDHDRRRPG